MCYHLKDKTQHKVAALIGCTSGSSVSTFLKWGCQLMHYFLFHLILHSYDYSVHIESLQLAKLCLVTLLKSEQNIQFQNKIDWQ